MLTIVVNKVSYSVTPEALELVKASNIEFKQVKETQETKNAEL